MTGHNNPLFENNHSENLFPSDFSIQEEYLFRRCLSLLIPTLYLDLPLNDLNATKSALGIYLLSLNIFQDAITEFLNHNYRAFDALVGNNSCYLVAYLVFILGSKIKQELLTIECRALFLQIEEIKNNTQKLYEKLHYSEFESSQIKLVEFIEFNHLLVDCKFDFLYLCLAYGCALSKEKNSNEHEEIEYQEILKKYQDKLSVPVTKKSVIKLIKHWQKLISHINVKTLQEHANFQAITANSYTRYIHPPYILEDNRGRLCTASYYAQKIIFNLLHNIPGALIGLQVNIIEQPKNYLSRFTLYYEVQTDRSLKRISYEGLRIDHPIYMYVGCRYISAANIDRNVIFEGVKNEFIHKNLADVIFAHEVTYPQYPKSLKAPNIIPKEPMLFQEIIKLKKLKGYSLEDPSDLCLLHIYVDSIQMQLLAIHEPAVYLPTFTKNCCNKKSS